RRSPSDYDFSLIAMDPTDSKTLYIASYLSYCCAGGAVSFRKTADGGDTWVDTNITPGIELGCCTLAIDPLNPKNLFLPGRLYAGGNYFDWGLMKSTDGGFSWTPTALINSVTPAIQRYYVNLVANDSQNSLYAATYAWTTGVNDFNGFTGLFKSTD